MELFVLFVIFAIPLWLCLFFVAIVVSLAPSVMKNTWGAVSSDIRDNPNRAVISILWKHREAVCTSILSAIVIIMIVVLVVMIMV